MIFFRLRLLILCLACTLAAPALPQTLARPGWQGSGMTADLWWKHAIFYEADPARFSPATGQTPLHSFIQRLDYLHTLGVDAVLLTPVQDDPAHATSVNPILGTRDDFDDLLREASSRDLRILLDLDPAIPSANLADTARFWLNRGVAGFHLGGTGSDAHARAAELRGITAAYLGRRIVLTDADPTLPSAPRQRTYVTANTQSPQLVLDASLAGETRLAASSIRPILDTVQDLSHAGHSIPLLATDSPAAPRSFTRLGDGQHDVAIAKIVATILLAAHAEPVLFYGQEFGVPSPAPDPPIIWPAAPATQRASGPQTSLPANVHATLEEASPNSLLDWYRQLIALHHGNAAINSGATVTVNEDDKNVLVWIRKPQNATPLTPALVIVCNLTAQPVALSLKADLARLGLHGSFLRTVLRSDNGMGAMHLDSMTIAPYTAYIGELRR